MMVADAGHTWNMASQVAAPVETRSVQGAAILDSGMEFEGLRLSWEFRFSDKPAREGVL